MILKNQKNCERQAIWRKQNQTPYSACFRSKRRKSFKIKNLTRQHSALQTFSEDTPKACRQCILRKEYKIDEAKMGTLRLILKTRSFSEKKFQNQFNLAIEIY